MYLTINKKLFITIITAISVIAVGAIGFIIYDKLVLSKKTDNEYITIIKDASIDINKLYKVGEILDKLDKAYASNESKYQGYIYTNKLLEVKDFDKNAAIYAAIYPEIIKSNTEYTISNERVKNRYLNIFGKSLEYKPSSLDLGEQIKVEYDKANKTYKYKAALTNNDHKGEYLARSIKTTIKDDLVVVTRKVFYVEYSGSNANIYTSSAKSSKIGEVSLKNGEVSLKEVIGKCGSRMHTYEYTFKLGSDDEYSFYKIERTK